MAGFPHSEIPGSKLDVSSPGLIADYYVLHRLLPPRHPPCALGYLAIYSKTMSFTIQLLTTFHVDTTMFVLNIRELKLYVQDALD